MAGIETTGFVAKTMAEIIEDMRARIISTIFPYAQFLPSQIITQITDIFADGTSTLWEGLNALFNSSYLTAEGVALDLVASIQGKRRNEATKAYMLQFNVVTSGATTIPANSRFGSTVTGAPVFETTEEIVISSATTTRINVYAVDAEEIGFDYSNTLLSTYTQNLDAVANISSVVNDATTTFINGSERETDGQLRSRLQNAFNNSNIYTLDAYRQAILNLNTSLTESGDTPIEDCFIIPNTSNSEDADGRPAKSIEVVIYYDGSADSQTDSAIATRIAAVTQGATETCSTTALNYSENITINDNTVFPVTFSRADEVEIFLSIEIEKSNGAAMSADEKTALKSYLAAWGNLIGLGNNVIIYGKNSISQALNEYTGLDISDYTIQAGRPALGTSNITIANTEISRFTTGHITLTDL